MSPTTGELTSIHVLMLMHGALLLCMPGKLMHAFAIELLHAMGHFGCLQDMIHMAEQTGPKLVTSVAAFCRQAQQEMDTS